MRFSLMTVFEALGQDFIHNSSGRVGIFSQNFYHLVPCVSLFIMQEKGSHSVGPLSTRGDVMGGLPLSNRVDFRQRGIITFPGPLATQQLNRPLPAEWERGKVIFSHYKMHRY